MWIETVRETEQELAKALAFSVSKHLTSVLAEKGKVSTDGNPSPEGTYVISGI